MLWHCVCIRIGEIFQVQFFFQNNFFTHSSITFRSNYGLILVFLIEFITFSQENILIDVNGNAVTALPIRSLVSTRFAIFFYLWYWISNRCMNVKSSQLKPWSSTLRTKLWIVFSFSDVIWKSSWRKMTRQTCEWRKK